MTWNKRDKERDERIKLLREQKREYFSTHYTHFKPTKLKDYENK
jgi:hypothetical protein